MSKGTRKLKCPHCDKVAYMRHEGLVDDFTTDVCDVLQRMTSEERIVALKLVKRTWIDNLCAQAATLLPDHDVEPMRVEAYAKHGCVSTN